MSSSCPIVISRELLATIYFISSGTALFMMLSQDKMDKLLQSN